MTVKEYVDTIGKEAFIRTAPFGVHGLLVKVTVEDVKMSYGKTRFLVKPVAGSGTVWVENLFEGGSK